MLLVNTKLDESSIHGIGLFAAEFIAKGTETWTYLEGFDFRLPPSLLDRLSAPARVQFLQYTYLVPELGLYELCSDDARFFNHSEDPNTGMVPSASGELLYLALRDIREGEELTCDYRAFDPDWKVKLGLSNEANG